MASVTKREAKESFRWGQIGRHHGRKEDLQLELKNRKNSTAGPEIEGAGQKNVCWQNGARPQDDSARTQTNSRNRPGRTPEGDERCGGTPRSEPAACEGRPHGQGCRHVCSGCGFGVECKGFKRSTCARQCVGRKWHDQCHRRARRCRRSARGACRQRCHPATPAGDGAGESRSNPPRGRSPDAGPCSCPDDQGRYHQAI